MEKNLNSAEKVLKILLALAKEEEGKATGELSKELGFTKPTASRLLQTLSKHDFVRRDSTGKKYVLGKSAFDIGRSAYGHIGSQLLPIAGPYIDALRDSVGESAVLEIMAGENAMLVYRANGAHAVGIFPEVGTMIPAHVSPGAKVILAFSPVDMAETILKRKLHRYTPKTITDPEQLRSSLVQIRKKGIAFASGEYNIDVHTLAAPVFDHEKRPVAAVVITMPVYRAKHHKPAKLVSLLKETAAKISQQLFQHGM
jgi:IclR family transcriptional regulator, KDG regulon repressor